MKLSGLFLAIALVPSVSIGQSFTCGIGDTPACLDYGDTVCSSAGKCVSQDAACFDSYQCNYEGFTCKSNLTECADEYDDLLMRFNSLVEDYNALLEDSQEIRAAFESALKDLEETQDELESVERNLRRSEATLVDLQDCIEGLDRLDDPNTCLMSDNNLGRNRQASWPVTPGGGRA